MSDGLDSPSLEVFETVPTFRPTLEEMQDFDGYLLKLKELGAHESGLTKLIPPENWDWKPSIEKARDMRVRNPISQCVTGRSGVYSVCNLVKKDLPLRAYEQIAMKRSDAPKDFSSQENLFEVERKFWKSLTTTAAPPLYGSDVEGTLFADSNVPFNVNKLDCLLKKCGVKLPGITNPMMYVGMWRSFFPFHTEDVNMFSVNVMHIGAPKFWYGIPPAETKRVEILAKGTWPDEHCPELMRHKTKLFSPWRLKQAGISFVRGVQREGEIMITWPSSFHGGFNSGFNIAEAVNFVPQSLFQHFISFAKQAGFCKCRPDTVILNIDWLEHQIKSINEGGVGVPLTAEPDKGAVLLDGAFAVDSTLEKVKKKKVTKPLKKRDKLRPIPLETRVGEWIELRLDDVISQPPLERPGDSIWVPVQVSQIVDGSARLHQKGTPRTTDIWLTLRSERIRISSANVSNQKFDEDSRHSLSGEEKRIKLEQDIPTQVTQNLPAIAVSGDFFTSTYQHFISGIGHNHSSEIVNDRPVI
jgi:jumonji domain-containing protein 2